MIPGTRDSEGRLLLIEAAPGVNDPRMGGFALNAPGQVYATRVPVTFLTPADLFANGEPGDYWDDTDRASMFQDLAMTIPAAVERTVAAQVGGANGIVATAQPGQEPTLSARYNKLQTSEQYDYVPAWNTTGDVIITGKQLAFAADTGFLYQQLITPVRSGQKLKAKAVLSGQAGSLIRFRIAAVVDPVNEAFTEVSLTPTPTEYTLDLTIAADDPTGVFIGLENRAFIGRPTPAVTVVAEWFSLTDDIIIPYQRTGATALSPGDYDDDPIKFPSYLVWGGAQAQQTPVVDFSSTDNLDVFSGVTFANAVGTHIISELGPEWNLVQGAFVLYGDDNFLAGASNGNAAFDQGLISGAPGPYTVGVPYVLTLLNSLDQNYTKLSYNGVAAPPGLADKGLGPFSGTNEINFGARVATDGTLSLQHLGTTTARIVRGAASTPDEIKGIERWIAARMPGAVLAAPPAGTPPAPYSNANSFLFDGLGRLCVTLDDPIAVWAGGLPFTKDGVLVITDLDPVPPDFGPELVVNGEFNNGTTGWAIDASAGATQQVVAGALELIGVTDETVAKRSEQVITTVVGKTYRIVAGFAAGAANTIPKSARVGVRHTLSDYYVLQEATANGVENVVDQTFVALTTSATIELGIASLTAWGGNGDTAFFDNISIREVTGIGTPFVGGLRVRPEGVCVSGVAPPVDVGGFSNGFNEGF